MPTTLGGFTELLRRFKVKTLLLPYIPLWPRLLIAFEEGIAIDDEEMVFFVNPAEYVGLREHVNRIVFVLPSGREGPPEPNMDPPFDPEVNHENVLQMYAKITCRICSVFCHLERKGWALRVLRTGRKGADRWSFRRFARVTP
jgi:hypothetical protein